MLKQENNNIRFKFTRNDISIIKELIKSAKLFLQARLSNINIMLRMDDFCTIYLNQGYRDRLLVSFKGIWSNYIDIEDEIKEGSSSKNDLKDYIKSEEKAMKEACEELIPKYTAILKEVEEKGYSYG